MSISYKIYISEYIVYIIKYIGAFNGKWAACCPVCVYLPLGLHKFYTLRNYNVNPMPFGIEINATHLFLWVDIGIFKCV